jgi:hypothetical protein
MKKVWESLTNLRRRIGVFGAADVLGVIEPSLLGRRGSLDGQFP